MFKSECCNADAIVIMSPDFLGDASEKMRIGTTYFECSKCKNPCNIRPIEEVVNEKEDKAAERLAKRFHEIYEKLAPKYNYQTRRQSAVSWSKVPAKNKNLMIAVCEQILKEGI